MNKQILITFLLLVMSQETIGLESGIVARVFNKEIIIPSECVLNVRPSVIDKDVRFSCSFSGKNIEIANIYFKPGNACKEDLNEIGKYEKVDFVLSPGELIVHASHRDVGKDKPVIHMRRIWDNEVCILALSNSDKLLNKILDKLWK